MEKTIILGDSIAEWNTLKDKRIINMGVAGDTTRDIFWRIEEVLKIDAKRVVLMVGVNDMLMGFDVEKSYGFYKKIIASIRGSYDEIVLLSILPTDGRRGINVNIKKMNKLIEAFAKENDLKFINFYSGFSDENSNLKSALSTDGIHLSTEGYDILNSELIKIL